MKPNQRLISGVALAVATFAIAGCDDFLAVENPTVIESTTVNPVTDAETFSLSAQTDFFDAYDNIVVYGAFFSGEAWVDDTFPTRNDIAQRTIDPRNGTVNAEVFAPLASAIASNERVLNLFKGTPQENSINAARAALNSGFAIQLMAETFCQGVISKGTGITTADLGPPLGTAETINEAINRFMRAVELGTTLKNNAIVNAAQVGLARAYLQKGDLAQASAAAQKVPANFRYDALKVDDPSFRTRLGNTPFFFTALRPNLVVPPYYRALNDPRVTFTREKQPSTGQGGSLEFFAQTKYPGYGTNVRLASGLEARYVHAEAQLKLGNSAPAQALIAERRIPSSAEGDDFASGNPLLIELLDQKSRDFYLEGKHMGDFRRNPQATPYVPPAGSRFYNPSVGGNIGAQTCFLIPEQETSNNPNFPKS